MIEQLNRRFWERAANSAYVTPESLGIFRWCYGLYLLLLEAPYFAWIGSTPRALFQPPILSPAAVFVRFPPSPLFMLLDVVVIASLCCVTVGYRTRVFTALLLVSKLVGANFQYSFGKIDHDIIMSALLMCMLIADWGRHYSVDARHASRNVQGQAVDRRAAQGTALFAVLLAFGMITAGLAKLLSWVDFNLNTSGFLSWFYPNYYSLGRTLLLADSVRYLPPLLCEIADYAAPVLELSGFLALLHSRKAWLAWLLLISSFHLVNALVLNIPFTAQAMTYLSFVELARLWATRTRAPGESASPRWLGFGASLVFLAGSWQLAARFFGSGSTIIFVTSHEATLRWALYLALPVCALVIAGLALELLCSLRPASRPAPAPH